jgi:epoxyqueuosine reductase
MIDNIRLELEDHSFKCQIVSVVHVKEIQQEIQERYLQKYFCREFYKERLAAFKFRLPRQLPKAKSLIIAAYPQPELRMIFNWNGKPHKVSLPPTYIHYPNARLERLLSNLLKPYGFQVAKTVLPLKLLAVRSGLGSFGKNNICYLPNWGSFHRLMAFFSDLPGEDEIWSESTMMRQCRNCTACLRACPTGAITSERFLIRAERCLTFLNEKKGRFPSWVDPSWHHCLFGCMRCQETCPLNKQVKNWIEDREEFTEQETALIMKKVPLGQIPASTRKKIEGLCMTDEYELWSRNLSFLFMNAFP